MRGRMAHLTFFPTFRFFSSSISLFEISSRLPNMAGLTFPVLLLILRRSPSFSYVALCMSYRATRSCCFHHRWCRRCFPWCPSPADIWWCAAVLLMTAVHPPFRLCHWIVLIPTSSCPSFSGEASTLTFSVAKLVQAVFCKYQCLIPWIFSKTFCRLCQPIKTFHSPGVK